MNTQDGVTLKDLIINITKGFRYLLRKWLLISIFAIVGIIIGCYKAYNAETKYKAECTFVILEGKPKSLLTDLSSIGEIGGNSSSGLFNNVDNIIWLYSTRLMIEQALLTQVKHEPKPGSELLINWFIEESNLKKTIAKNYPNLLNTKIDNNYQQGDSLSTNQETLMGICVSMIKAGYLKVSETQATHNLVTVQVDSKDQLFSKNFAEVIVNRVNDFYIRTKVKKQADEVAALSKKVDSVKANLDNSLLSAAVAVENVPYANPLKTTLKVNPQNKEIQADINRIIYTELIKSLETKQMILSESTPLIQIVDIPILPLNSTKLSYLTGASIGGFIMAILCILGLTLHKSYKLIIESKEDA